MTMSSMLRVTVQLLVVLIPVIEAENPKDTSAVGKVMEMLHEIQVKSEDELFKETLTFTEFDNWCNNTKEEREASIKANEGTEETLTAEIKTKSANIEDLTNKIAGLEDDISNDNAKITQLTADRSVAKTSYSKEVEDLSTAITALKKGIDGLEAAKKPSFLQLRSRAVSKPPLALADFLGLKGGAATTLIENAMQPDDSHLKGYDFDLSDGLSDTLWGILDNMRTAKTTADQEEMKAVNTYMLAVQTEKQTMARHQRGKDDSELQKSRDSEAKADAEKNLKLTQDALLADRTYLQDTKTMCADKKAAWLVRKDTREGEIQVLDKAGDIMKEGMATNASYKKSNLVQIGTSVGMAVFHSREEMFQAAEAAAESVELPTVALPVNSDAEPPVPAATPEAAPANADAAEPPVPAAATPVALSANADVAEPPVPPPRKYDASEPPVPPPRKYDASEPPVPAPRKYDASEPPVPKVSLLQFQGPASDNETPERQNVRRKLMALLRRKSIELRSPMLLSISRSVNNTALGGVTDKLKDLISDLSSQNEDKLVKCEQDRATLATQLNESKTLVFRENTRLAAAEADNATKTQKKQRLTKEIAELDADKAKATAIRNKEAANAAHAIKEATQGKQAVAMAKDVLGKFYGSKANATAANASKLNGTSVNKDAPGPGFDTSEAYKGSGASGVVLGMLDVILDDFKQTLNETNEAESQATTEFETFSGETDSDKDKKQKELEETESAMAKLELDTDSLKTQTGVLKTRVEQLAAVEIRCSVGAVAEDRIAKRQAEMAALKEAIDYLDQVIPQLG